MISIIKDYLNKITVHNNSLSQTEKYINKPWVHTDNDGNYHKYIFNPDGDLFMSFNGMVEIGKWKYLTEANLIFIDRLSDKILLKQCFFDESVMILKIDGTTDDLFILANENVIKDLDVAKYLSSLVANEKKIDNSNFYLKKLITGDNLRINREELDYTKVGMVVSLNDKHVSDGEYLESTNLENKFIVYIIKDSKINDIIWLFIYNTSKGVFRIYQKKEFVFSLGDYVTLNNNPAPNGKHRMGLMEYIHVKNSVISGTSIL